MGIRINCTGQRINEHVARTLRQELYRNHVIASYAKAHPAQTICVAELYVSVELVDPDALEHEMMSPRPMTVAGIPLRVDRSMPEDEIRYYDDKDRLIAEIVNLGKPEL